MPEDFQKKLENIKALYEEHMITQEDYAKQKEILQKQIEESEKKQEEKKLQKKREKVNASENASILGGDLGELFNSEQNPFASDIQKSKEKSKAEIPDQPIKIMHMRDLFTPATAVHNGKVVQKKKVDNSRQTTTPVKEEIKRENKLRQVQKAVPVKEETKQENKPRQIHKAVPAKKEAKEESCLKQVQIEISTKEEAAKANQGLKKRPPKRKKPQTVSSKEQELKDGPKEEIKIIDTNEDQLSQSPEVPNPTPSSHFSVENTQETDNSDEFKTQSEPKSQAENLTTGSDESDNTGVNETDHPEVNKADQVETDERDDVETDETDNAEVYGTDETETDETGSVEAYGADETETDETGSVEAYGTDETEEDESDDVEIMKETSSPSNQNIYHSTVSNIKSRIRNYNEEKNRIERLELRRMSLKRKESDDEDWWEAVKIYQDYIKDYDGYYDDVLPEDYGEENTEENKIRSKEQKQVIAILASIIFMIVLFIVMFV